jgi:glucokinase
MLWHRRARRARTRHGRRGVTLVLTTSQSRFPDPVLLVGDIGGTRTRLALYDESPGALRRMASTGYESKSASTLEEIIVRFLGESGNPDTTAACFGVAGAVVGGKVRTTNLPWQISEAGLAEHLNIPRVRLINDLEAAAHGVVAITDPTSLVTLQKGSPPSERGALALVSAGTGLGVALMWWDGHAYQVAPSEGGHCDFAPQDELEDALGTWLREQFGHVSYERILSGPGLVNLYQFLRAYRKIPEPGWLTTRIGFGDPAPVIADAALDHADPVCDETLTRFVRIYGAAAGNYALTSLAVGGVFLGGGIAPKILSRLKDGPFLDAFAAKGRFSEAMRKMPIHVVMAPDVALLGAAFCVSGNQKREASSA